MPNPITRCCACKKPCGPNKTGRCRECRMRTCEDCRIVWASSDLSARRCSNCAQVYSRASRNLALTGIREVERSF